MSHAWEEFCFQGRWKRAFQEEEWLGEQRKKRILCKKTILPEKYSIAWKACFGKNLGKMVGNTYWWEKLDWYWGQEGALKEFEQEVTLYQCQG